MAEYLLYGKRRLCYTDISDYTDYQGIGHDPMYKRFDSVDSVVNHVIDPEFRHFLAHPVYSSSLDRIEWYVDNWKEQPRRYKDLEENDKIKYTEIKDKTLLQYRTALMSIEGEDLQILSCALRYIDDDSIFCFDNKVVVVAWGMKPDTGQQKIIGAIIHQFFDEKKYRLCFDAAPNGHLNNILEKIISRPENFVLTSKDIPSVTAEKGYCFKGWLPEPLGFKVTDDCLFKAVYEKLPESESEVGRNKIVMGDFASDPSPSADSASGNASGEESASMENSENAGSSDSKYFSNENPDIEGETVSEDPNIEHNGNDKKRSLSSIWTVCKKTFKDKGCLRWLLWLLMLLLFILLVSFILRACQSCSEGDYDGSEVLPIDTLATSSGSIDDNNNRRDIEIIKDDGTITDDATDNIIAPIVGDDGSLPPIEENPGAPSIISNRLNIYFENEDVSLDDFAIDFKKIYPGEEYRIIGYDEKVKMIQIQIPEAERNSIRESINARLTDYKFFVVDESIFQCVGNIRDHGANAGWHLKAVNVFDAWNETTGDRDIVVAVVDDGIDYNHPIFSGKIVGAYNVFTQNNRLSMGSGHGTHVAGLAVGNSKFVEKGVSGIAPDCKLMPVQVFDNKLCTFSSITSGIMYAVHEGADVVNISIGPSFNGLSILPVEAQKKIAETQFKNEEKVWRKIIRIANEHNCILVFAVGNDKVLASMPPENRTDFSVNVAAVDQACRPAAFSNYGKGANISAPGVEIFSSYPVSDFKFFDGTSMAAPIVAGTIALMKSIDKDISVGQVLAVLQKTGKPVSFSIPPMILVDRALQAVKNKDYGNGYPGENAGSEDGGKESDGQENNIPVVDEDNNSSDMSDATDYDMIRRMIEEYKRKIEELERLLPENQKK